jgi:hypothetical protein
MPTQFKVKGGRMITVEIRVNNKTVYCRSARNTGVSFGGGWDDKYLAYDTDASNVIPHDPKKGIVKLAIKMLKTIKEI